METASRWKDPSALADEFKDVERQEAKTTSRDAALAGHARPWRWVPIRSLAPRHRERMTHHLLQLPPGDLYLRFGYMASPVQVTRYVDTIDFERDEVFGIFNRHLALVALAHLAYAPATQADGAVSLAEFGVSVLPGARGRGYGARLFDHAVLHARNRGVGALFIHALSQNEAMLKIAKRAGAQVERDAGESEAWLKLPQDSVASHWEEAVAGQAAELNYRLKAHAKGVQTMLESALKRHTQADAKPDTTHRNDD